MRDKYKMIKVFVQFVDIQDDIIRAVVPAWCPYKLVNLEKHRMREDLQPYIKPGSRWYAHVNIMCESMERPFV